MKLATTNRVKIAYIIFFVMSILGILFFINIREIYAQLQDKGMLRSLPKLIVISYYLFGLFYLISGLSLINRNRTNEFLILIIMGIVLLMLPGLFIPVIGCTTTGRNEKGQLECRMPSDYNAWTK